MTYFETIKCDNEDVFNLEYHQQRISRTIGLNINLQEFIYPPNNQLLKCKVTYDKNGILDIVFSKYKAKEILTFKIVVDENITYKYKSTNRTNIDELYAKKGDASEIIIVKNNLITDTSIANIAIFDGNHWLTPKSPLLEGTCKARLMMKKSIRLENITLEQLQKAEKLALMNAMIGFKIIDNFDIIYK